MFPNKTLIWKTQHPAGCNTSVSNDPADYRRIATKFNWALFEGWDEIAREVFSNRSLNEYVLDMKPLYYRTDSHPGNWRIANVGLGKKNQDCLHACYPGPISLMPTFVLHMMEVGRL